MGRWGWVAALAVLSPWGLIVAALLFLSGCSYPLYVCQIMNPQGLIVCVDAESYKKAQEKK